MGTIPTSNVELFKACADKDRKVMWVLYDSPYDFPGQMVIRFFVCDQDADCRPRGTSFFETTPIDNEPLAAKSELEEHMPYFEKGRWRFTPEFDPENPQIIGTYT